MLIRLISTSEGKAGHARSVSVEVEPTMIMEKFQDIVAKNLNISPKEQILVVGSQPLQIKSTQMSINDYGIVAGTLVGVAKSQPSQPTVFQDKNRVSSMSISELVLKSFPLSTDQLLPFATELSSRLLNSETGQKNQAACEEALEKGAHVLLMKMLTWLPGAAISAQCLVVLSEHPMGWLCLLESDFVGHSMRIILKEKSTESKMYALTVAASVMASNPTPREIYGSEDFANVLLQCLEMKKNSTFLLALLRAMMCFIIENTENERQLLLNSVTMHLAQLCVSMFGANRDRQGKELVAQLEACQFVGQLRPMLLRVLELLTEKVLKTKQDGGAGVFTLDTIAEGSEADAFSESAVSRRSVSSSVTSSQAFGGFGGGVAVPDVKSGNSTASNTSRISRPDRFSPTSHSPVNEMHFNFDAPDVSKPHPKPSADTGRARKTLDSIERGGGKDAGEPLIFDMNSFSKGLPHSGQTEVEAGRRLRLVDMNTPPGGVESQDDWGSLQVLSSVAGHRERVIQPESADSSVRALLLGNESVESVTLSPHIRLNSDVRYSSLLMDDLVKKTDTNPDESDGKFLNLNSADSAVSWRADGARPTINKFSAEAPPAKPTEFPGPFQYTRVNADGAEFMSGIGTYAELDRELSRIDLLPTASVSPATSVARSESSLDIAPNSQRDIDFVNFKKEKPTPAPESARRKVEVPVPRYIGETWASDRDGGHRHGESHSDRHHRRRHREKQYSASTVSSHSTEISPTKSRRSPRTPVAKCAMPPPSHYVWGRPRGDKKNSDEKYKTSPPKFNRPAESPPRFAIPPSPDRTFVSAAAAAYPPAASYWPYYPPLPAVAPPTGVATNIAVPSPASVSVPLPHPAPPPPQIIFQQPLAAESGSELLAYERVWRLQAEVDALEDLVGGKSERSSGGETINRLFRYLAVGHMNAFQNSGSLTRTGGKSDTKISDFSGERSDNFSDEIENRSKNGYTEDYWRPSAQQMAVLAKSKIQDLTQDSKPSRIFEETSYSNLQRYPPSEHSFRRSHTTANISNFSKFPPRPQPHAPFKSHDFDPELEALEGQALEFDALSREAKLLLGHHLK